MGLTLIVINRIAMIYDKGQYMAIVSFKHKGLKLFYTTGSTKAI